MKRKERRWFILIPAAVLAMILIGWFFFSGSPAGLIVIERNGYGEGGKEERVYLEEEEIIFPVEERTYTEEELEEAFEQAFCWAEENMLLENTSRDEVRSDLNFMSEIPGGFLADWISSDTDVIWPDGTLLNTEWEEEKEQLVSVTLILSYGEHRKQEELAVLVKGPVLTEREQLIRKIRKAIMREEERTRTEASFVLPEEIENVLIRQEQGQGLEALFLLLGVGILFFYARKENKKKELREKKSRELREDYPLFVNKVILYLGAGLNLKSVFEMMQKEFKEEEKRNGRRSLYEPFQIMMNEMNAGVGEKQAYEQFARRTGESLYLGLMSLLIQNLQKGNEGLIRALWLEEETAFSKRLEQAKIKGEKAGTKLLFPMLLLLMVVMAVVMAPALFQFQAY